jgi:hypothetical protein
LIDELKNEIWNGMHELSMISILTTGSKSLIRWVLFPSYRNICCYWLFLQLWPPVLFKNYASNIYFVC